MQSRVQVVAADEFGNSCVDYGVSNGAEALAPCEVRHSSNRLSAHVCTISAVSIAAMRTWFD